MENNLFEGTNTDEEKELYEKFLDSRSVREKREILKKMKVKGYLTEKMINDFAVTLDIVVPDGDVDDMYYDLLRCLDSLARFETTGLR